MNDERLGQEISDFYRETDITPPDPKESAREVAGRLSQVEQVTRRRWPSDWLTRASHQPSPIPAANGHTPTVIGRTTSMLSPVKAITAGAIVFALGGVLLIAQPFDRQAATGPGIAAESLAMRPAMVTGTILHHYEAGETTGLVETGDHRLNGTITSELTFELFPEPVLPGDTGLDAGRIYDLEQIGAELSWGALRITNDDGWWDGRMVCAPTLLTNGSEDPCLVELSGAGAYDGLSALLVQRDRISASGYEPRDESYQLDGLIFPGDLPPDR